ncbi:MAG: hypothetical protein ACJ716_00715, partial [Marmoricola sp.]
QQAAAEAAANSALAHRASQVASSTKHHATTTKPPKATTPPVTAGEGTVPGSVGVPDTGDPAQTVNGALSGLQSGVDALLGQVDQATGGVTTPLTTTVNTTLHGLLP